MTTVTVERDGAIASITLPDQGRLGTTADHGNAVRAFLAKEKPVFQGS